MAVIVAVPVIGMTIIAPALTIIKNSDHRLSSEKDLLLLKRTIKNMIKDM